MTQGGADRDPWSAPRWLRLEGLLAAALLVPWQGERPVLGAPSEGAKDFFDRLCSALSTSNAFAFAWQALGVALVEPELRNELADTELLDMLVEPALRRGSVDSELLEKLEVVLAISPPVSPVFEQHLRWQAMQELRSMLKDAIILPPVKATSLPQWLSKSSEGLVEGAAGHIALQLDALGMSALAIVFRAPASPAFGLLAAYMAQNIRRLSGPSGEFVPLETPSLIDRWVAELYVAARVVARSRSDVAARSIEDDSAAAFPTAGDVPSGAPAAIPYLAMVAPAPASLPSFEEAPSPLTQPKAPAAAPRFDGDVQFTVYRPSSVVPSRWYPLPAFAHHSRRRGEDNGEPDPLAEVERQAKQILGAEKATNVALGRESSHDAPLDGEITFVPVLPGFEVTPERRTFRWNEPVHREEFRVRAPPSLIGQRVVGHLSVYWGSLLIADVQLAIRVGWYASNEVEPASARAYRKIFASYSHKDRRIVDQVTRLAKAFGDDYLTDCLELRSREVWSDRLRELIQEADVFQLFWSWNSMESKFVRAEWEHAMQLGRVNFVRPTYWERPLPTLPEKGLPPQDLALLQFQEIGTALAPAEERIRATMLPGAQVGFLLNPALPRSTPGLIDTLARPGPAEFVAPRPARGARLNPILVGTTTGIAVLTFSLAWNQLHRVSSGSDVSSPFGAITSPAEAIPSLPAATQEGPMPDEPCARAIALAAEGNFIDANLVFGSCEGGRFEAGAQISLFAQRSVEGHLANGDCDAARAVVDAVGDIGVTFEPIDEQRLATCGQQSPLQ